MPWLFLLLALGALIVAFNTTSVALMALCLIAALVLALVGVMQLLAARVDSSTRSESLMLDPMELRRLRDEAEARKLAAANANATPIVPTPSGEPTH